MSADSTSADHASLTIAHRFRGPARSGNGGYTAGLLAGYVAGLAAGVPVTVTLRRPPPFDVALDVVPSVDGGTGGGVELRHGGEVVASAAAGEFAGSAVQPVSLDAASAALTAYRGATQHPFPECFVCGPQRDPGDGLRLTPGLWATGRTACVWLPDPANASTDDIGRARRALGWAALDCPGGWTSDIGNRPLVLGRMTAYAEPARVGKPHVIVGQLLREEGRKTFTATSMYDEGRLVGRAEQTWVQVDPATFADLA